VTTRRPILERVVFAKNQEELAAAYADWAADYDSDLVDEMGYEAPFTAAALLHEHLDMPDARILDAGCGTGLVGKALAALGHSQIDGLDFSAEMLAQAQKKGVYQRFIQADLTQPLGIADNEYEATACVGTLNLSHVGPGAISELVRVTSGGGPVCFTVREEAWVRDPYEETLAELEQAGQCRLRDVREIPYIEEEGSSCRLCLLETLDA